MPDLTRTRHPDQACTRVIFVRQPVKDVRREHDRDLLPVRLAIGVIVALGVGSAVWLIGFLGFHLGFARAIGVPDLLMPAGGGLVAGLRALYVLPLGTISAAQVQPVLLMAGFLLIAIPASSLAVIGPPQTPGGPRPHILAVVFSHIGAAAAGLLAILLAWWTIHPFRTARLGAMPFETAAFDAWLTNVRVIAGLDALAVIAAAVWVVLVMRLVIPRWLKGLCASAIFVGLAVVIVAMSISAGTLSQMEAPRTVAGNSLVIGRIDANRVATMRVEGHIIRTIEATPERVAVREYSIAAFLR